MNPKNASVSGKIYLNKYEIIRHPQFVLPRVNLSKNLRYQ